MQKMQWCKRSRTGLGRGELRLVRPQIGNPSEHVRAAPLAILAALFLTACTTPSEPRIITKEVMVPIVQPCPDRRDPAPDFVDTLEAIQAAASKGSDALVALLLGGREQRIARQEASDAQVSACAG